MEPKIVIHTKPEPLPDAERRLLELIDGAEPKNDDEKKMVEDIRAIEKRGHVVEIPFM